MKNDYQIILDYIYKFEYIELLNLINDMKIIHNIPEKNTKKILNFFLNNSIINLVNDNIIIIMKMPSI